MKLIEPIKNNMTIISASEPTVSLILTDEVRVHLMRHFSDLLPGSKFSVGPPERLLQTIVDRFPETISNATVNNGCKIVSLTFPFNIGTCNVIPLTELTPEEQSTLHLEHRGESIVRCAISSRQFPTDSCQLILDDKNQVITVYPGELAPPLPSSPDIPDPYWDKHVFIKQ